MKNRHALPVLAALAALALTGCGLVPAQADDRNTEAVYAHTWSGMVVTSCDQFGNRVYESTTTRHTFAVVGKDATCPQPKVGQ